MDTSQDTLQKKRRVCYEKVDTTEILSFLYDAHATHADLAKEFGCHPTTLAGWIQTGQAPRYTKLCIEALRRRMNKPSDSDVKTFLVQINGAKGKTIQEVLKALGATVTELEL